MANTNNNKTLNVPNLRFPEFKGEWKKTTLKKECDINPSTGRLQESFMYIDLGSVVKGRLNNPRKIDKTDAPSRAQRILSENDIIFQCVRPYQMNNYIFKGFNDKSQWVASTGYAQLRTANNNPEYIYFLLNSPQFNKKVILECTGSNYPAINSEDLSKIPFYKSSSTIEQEKIAHILLLLDQRITTQNKIIEKLQSLIKGIPHKVAKLGIQNGSWEETLLSNVLVEHKELNKELHSVYSVSVSEGVVNQIEYLGRSFAAKDTSNYHVVQYGDIVYTKSPTGDFPFGIVKQSYIEKPAAISPLYGVYSPISFETGVYLHYYFMSAISATNYLYPLIQKGAKNTINISNQRFLENRVAIPTIKTEIHNTAKALIVIQKKLSLEKMILASLITQKQYLLQQMFI